MKWVASFSLVLAIAAAAFTVWDYLRPAETITKAELIGGEENSKREEERLAERIRKAEEKSAAVKGVYMTSAVASDGGRPATKLRNDILRLVDETEINAVVIDVKETDGGLIVNDQLLELITELHEKNAWVIARQVVFKDSSQEKNHPEWYLKKKSNGAVWRDRRGGSWLDMASYEVWDYQIAAAKAAADAGFDEIQFDYIRFPSDGNIADIVYPVYDEERPRYEVLREFFRFVHDELKKHRPELVISADLFGYAAIQRADLGIGQRLEDIGENFDYISLMVYPSHYYSGFQVAPDRERNLPGLFFPYTSSDISKVASNHPYEVVSRSLLIARDMLDGKIATTTDQGDQRDENDETAATSSPSSSSSSSAPRAPRRARLRPWLQDFDLAVDSNRGIHYDAKKVRAQIDAAEAAGSSGWLLWSASNIYTKEALKPEYLSTPM